MAGKSCTHVLQLREIAVKEQEDLSMLYTSAVSRFQNMWVRYGAVGFIAAVARTLNVADVHCNLLPQLQPFLKQPVVQVDQEVS